MRYFLDTKHIGRHKSQMIDKDYKLTYTAYGKTYLDAEINLEMLLISVYIDEMKRGKLCESKERKRSGSI